MSMLVCSTSFAGSISSNEPDVDECEECYEAYDEGKVSLHVICCDEDIAFPTLEPFRTSPLNPSKLAKSISSIDYRAMSFPANPVNAVGGKLKKGDAVDIIATIYSTDPTKQSITKTIFQGVPVFDVMGYGETLSAITLLVTLEQAEIIKHAYNLGDVSYSLNPENAHMRLTYGMTDHDFLARYNIHP